MTGTGEELMNEAAAGRRLLLDVRPGAAYTKGHVAHSLSAPYVQRGWAAAVKNWLDRQGPIPVVVLADNAVVGAAAQHALTDAGVSSVSVMDGGPEAWQTAGLRLVSVPDIAADQLAGELAEWTVIDVREPYEWRSGVIPGARTIPLNQLPHEAGALETSRRYALVCAHGNRSQAAAAFLADRGYQVANVRGGMALWLAGRHPTAPVG
ncbi:MAG: rhodanese-like domain-containing protein [Thermaerobacter sp.]|nr:rhodanese-like domain-containing protein [Thermaerobacter sp.]